MVSRVFPAVWWVALSCKSLTPRISIPTRFRRVACHILLATVSEQKSTRRSLTALHAVVGLPVRSSSSSDVRPSLNWSHHTETCLREITSSPYTSTTSLWICVGDCCFAFRNRIATRTSTLDGFSIEGILKTDWHNLKIHSNNGQPLPPWEEVSKACTEIWVRSSYVHPRGSASVPYFWNFPRTIGKYFQKLL
jgi:hypothetical protein